MRAPSSNESFGLELAERWQPNSKLAQAAQKAAFQPGDLKIAGERKESGARIIVLLTAIFSKCSRPAKKAKRPKGGPENDALTSSMVWVILSRMRARITSGLFSAVAFCAVIGCATVSFPPLDLGAPGWQTRQAQAIWQPDREKPEIAGDLIIGTHPSLGAMVEFLKTFPIASAQTSDDSWEINFPPQRRHYSGRGKGPARVVWLQLIAALESRTPAAPWTLSKPSASILTLENKKTGERLEVHF